MTERERWIVYPLLFLALGAALRDKLVDRTTTKSIVCEELTIVDEEPTGNQPPRVLAKIGREPRAGGAAYFWIDGNVDIIDVNTADGSSPRTLVKLGRTEPSQGVKAIGFAAINGHVLLGNVFMPSLPGGAVPNFLHELPASPSKQPPNKPESKSPNGRPQASPPAGKSEDTAVAPANSNSPRDTAPQK